MAKRTKRRNKRYSQKRNSKKRRVSKRRQRVSKKTYKRKNMRGGSGIDIISNLLENSKYKTIYDSMKKEDKDIIVQTLNGNDSGTVKEILKGFLGMKPGHALSLLRGYNESPSGVLPEGVPPTAAPVSAILKLEKKFVEDKTIHPYRELFDESGKTTELIGGILSHGSQEEVSNIDEYTFTITPVDLYLMTSDEVYLEDDATRAAIGNKWNYFRKYTAGGLIQNYELNFYTVAGTGRALGGLLHFSGGVDKEQLIENLIFRDDISEDREMFSHHQDIYFHKELLKNKVDDPNFNGEIIYKLSDIFKFIVAAKREGEVVPDKWIGRFCRGGDEDVFPLGISFFGECGNSELGELPSDFFKGKVDVSDKLVTQYSLSTSNMLQNFTGIFNDIVQYVSSGNTIPKKIEEYINRNYEMTLQDFLEIMKSSIEIFHPLKYKDICVILLMYNILTS
jgi:hypothetical protein